ncbi:DUF1440 domain-containing protein [Chloroflexi bacterium TSY]|nr:DUF1440 domain-containing protein [Chloroflexi bacterium TSY]
MNIEQPRVIQWINQSPTRQYGVTGAVSGLLGGLILAFIVSLPYSPWIHYLLSILLGIGFGLLFGTKIRTPGEGLIWGESFGLLWWLIGVLTLTPLSTGQPLLWTFESAQELVPLLMGWTLGFGSTLGLAYYWIRQWLESFDSKLVPALSPELQLSDEIIPLYLRAILVGGLSGILGSWLFVRGIDGATFYPLVAEIVGSTSLMLGQTLHYLIGIVIGISFGLLFQRDIQGPGAGLIWGLNYGFVWWGLGTLTFVPLLIMSEIPNWSLEMARATFPSLISHLLYGAAVGYQYGIVNRVWRILFVHSDPLNRTSEGSGAQGVRNVLMGIAGGIVGGLLFTLVMLGIGALPSVARLVGTDSAFVGFLVHLAISILIGISYGLFFQKQAVSYGAGLAWGLLYGFLWWLFGALTLYSLLLRQPPDWSLQAVVERYPSLIGHLLYGAGLGLFFQYLSQQYDPKQYATTYQRRAAQMLAEQRRQIRRTSAPSLWIVTLVLGIVLPLLLGAPQ